MSLLWYNQFVLHVLSKLAAKQRLPSYVLCSEDWAHF